MPVRALGTSTSSQCGTKSPDSCLVPGRGGAKPDPGPGEAEAEPILHPPEGDLGPPRPQAQGSREGTWVSWSGDRLVVQRSWWSWGGGEGEVAKDQRTSSRPS